MIQNNVWLIVSLVVLAGLGVFWLRKQRKLHQSRSWPSAEGRVDATDLRLRSLGSNQSKWFATVTYSYSALGASCSGTLQRTYMLKGHAEKWIANFSPGQVLSVRYNPAKPSDSVCHEDEQSAAPAAPPSPAS